MGLVQAQMAFFHEKIGTKALNEVFEIRDEQLCADLERTGQVKKVEGEQAQAHQNELQRQQEVGKINAQANEAVSMASHAHNQQANQSAQKAQEIRKQVLQQKGQAQGQTQDQAKSKKATEK